MRGAFRLPEAWSATLADANAAPAAFALARFLADRDTPEQAVFPPAHLRFRALELVAPDAVRAVILGQDPYHGAGQAHGLAFSVPDGMRPPPSLNNIFKELHRDLGITPLRNDNLERWARQGVLLLNTVLTVEEGRPGSHQSRGWEELTDAVIAATGNKAATPSVFMLWGSHARKKLHLIDQSRHLVLQAPHPSPLSAYRGFFGCGHFSAANIWLVKNGRGKIDW